MTEIDLAKDPNTPPEILEELAALHDGFYMTYYVASNPNTPQHTLIKLSRHHAIEISIAALSNPNLPEQHVEEELDLTPPRELWYLLYDLMQINHFSDRLKNYIQAKYYWDVTTNVHPSIH